MRTFPAPDASPQRLRVVSYTCSGGISTPIPPWIFESFRSPEYRARLFDLALDMKPDLVIANGDHVYYDISRMSQLQDHFLGPLITGVIRASLRASMTPPRFSAAPTRSP
ncbi:MAG: hypothetical protein U5K56_11900 [Halioglobus sp.]|nr:hypothetical protein [Halioglobus sp.]